MLRGLLFFCLFYFGFSWSGDVCCYVLVWPYFGVCDGMVVVDCDVVGDDAVFDGGVLWLFVVFSGLVYFDITGRRLYLGK